MTARPTKVLIIGSGPEATEAAGWARGPFTHIVAINNAWAIRPDWDFTIHPEDFPPERRPTDMAPGQRMVDAAEYVPVQNSLGGFVYAGGTMAFTAGYWALATLRPEVMAFVGCNMIYPATGKTHFYGRGDADPLREDITLQSLEAKSARLALIAGARGCACVTLSRGESRLLFPRGTPDTLSTVPMLTPEPESMAAAEARERALGYMVPSGRYWEIAERFDAAELRALDDLWLAAHARAMAGAEGDSRMRRLG
ncbi:MAG: hypothetical protein JJ938_14105 [Roseicyclus sp.]|nr:hypothetical protein [Roseicyclus sp.]MBO6626010.1 hypothetical protein [Roseicyclus sp.]MBO6920623.1 hypothetical protein [Roseicyclus sp.]